MITAITLPLMALICIVITTLGRIAYTVGYINYGPKGRVTGSLVNFLNLVALMVGAIITIAIWPTDKTYKILPLSYNELQTVVK